MNAEKPRPTPTPEQAAAVGARDRDVLLAAGAGTGKTRVLAERYCEALADLAAEGDESPVESILAFTFTERAAGELRDRIRRYLHERAAEAEASDHEAARRMRRWANGLSRAWISTIHGFCRKLLAVHPTRLGLDPRFRVLEQSEADRLAADAFDAALERFLADGERNRVDVLAMFKLRGLREAILSVHSELRSQGRAPELPPAVPSEPVAALAALAAAAEGALAECDEVTQAGAQVNIEKMRVAVQLAAGEPPESAQIAAVAFSSTAKAFAGDAVAAYLDAVKAAERAVVETESLERYELVRELLTLFAADYEAAKAERSGLDFEDLQLEAVRLLSGNPDLRERYRERFRHLMVDEFQDTNLSQKLLIDLLHGDGNHLFCVGDELQSIYGFRHADVGVFRALREQLGRPDDPGEVLPLTGNFRSTAAVIGAVNALGEALIGEGYTPLTPGDPDATGPDPGAELLLVPTTGGKTSLWKENAKDLGLEYDGDNAPGPVRVAEARMLAARLRELHDTEGVKQSEMVILLRAFTPVAAIESELRRAGLDPYVVGGRGYWQQQQVDDIRRLLEAIANPYDELGLLGMLASPAGGVSPDALWLIRDAADSGRLWPALGRLFGGVPVKDDERAAEIERARESFDDRDTALLKEFYAAFESLRERAPSLSLEELIEAVTGESGYDLAVLMREDGARRTANVRKLMRMARAYEAAEGRNLRGFLDHLDERSGDGSEGEAAVAAEGREVVRIMTVHAAKGLEFPVVAFADAGRGLLDGGFPPVLRVGRRIPGEDEENPAANRVGIQMARWGAKRLAIFNYIELAEEAEAADAEESLRLAHVAFTRAEKRLIVSGAVRLGALAKEPKLSAPVSERLVRGCEIELGGEEDAEGEGSASIPGPAGERIALTIARPSAEWAASVPRRDRAAGAVPDGELAAPLLAPDPGPPAVMPAKLSYTSISLHEECAFRFYAERALGIPEDEGRPGAAGAGTARARGRAVHMLLEWSARHGWEAPGPELVEATLAQEGINRPAEAARVAEQVDAWMTSQLKSEIETTGGAVRAEADFALSAGGAVIGGQIDLLAPRDGAGPLVVDYKTNRLDGADPGPLFEAKYAIQRDIYALAAAGREGQSVTTAFVFLERPGEPVRDELGPAELAAARERVEAAVASIETGEFRASDEPSESLCSGCPARAGLCPRWQWNDGTLEIADVLFT